MELLDRRARVKRQPFMPFLVLILRLMRRTAPTCTTFNPLVPPLSQVPLSQVPPFSQPFPKYHPFLKYHLFPMYCTTPFPGTTPFLISNNREVVFFFIFCTLTLRLVISHNYCIVKLFSFFKKDQPDVAVVNVVVNMVVNVGG